MYVVLRLIWYIKDKNSCIFRVHLCRGKKFSCPWILNALKQTSLPFVSANCLEKAVVLTEPPVVMQGGWSYGKANSEAWGGRRLTWFKRLTLEATTTSVVTYLNIRKSRWPLVFCIRLKKIHFTQVNFLNKVICSDLFKFIDCLWGVVTFKEGLKFEKTRSVICKSKTFAFNFQVLNLGEWWQLLFFLFFFR